MKKIAKITAILLFFFFLTILTQVGGIIYLIFLLLWHKKIKHLKKFRSLKKSYLYGIKTFSFLFFYVFITLFIIPVIAKPFGRVALPVFSDPNVKPLNVFTCLLNRHYVKEELLNSVEEVALELNEIYPNTTIAYLDANFPFIDNFPLLPHLSHNDGEKIDIAFFYKDTKTKEPLNRKAPSFIGYGVFEKPTKNEFNQPNLCEKRGSWQYSFLGKIVPQWNKSEYIFDEKRTKTLIDLFTKHQSIGKIFIEPHLKKRMNLHSNKIRYHGCQAVRHDDHIHVQL